MDVDYGATDMEGDSNIHNTTMNNNNNSNNGTTKRVQHCTFCKNHGLLTRKTSHKCRYESCHCILCKLTTCSRLVMRHQQRLWRHHKDARRRQSAAAAATQNPHAAANPATNPPQQCDMCRNHGLVQEKRGHKNSCQYQDCKCPLCDLTRKRRDIMRHMQRVRRSQVTSREHDRAFEYVTQVTEELAQKFSADSQAIDDPRPQPPPLPTPHPQPQDPPHPHSNTTYNPVHQPFSRQAHEHRPSTVNHNNIDSPINSHSPAKPHTPSVTPIISLSSTSPASSLRSSSSSSSPSLPIVSSASIDNTGNNAISPRVPQHLTLPIREPPPLELMENSPPPATLTVPQKSPFHPSIDLGRNFNPSSSSVSWRSLKREGEETLYVNHREGFFRDTHLYRNLFSRPEQCKTRLEEVSKYDTVAEDPSLTTSTNNSSRVLAVPLKRTRFNKNDEYMHQQCGQKFWDCNDSVIGSSSSGMSINSCNSPGAMESSFSRVGGGAGVMPSEASLHQVGSCYHRLTASNTAASSADVTISSPPALIPLPHYNGNNHLVRPQPLAPHTFHYPPRLVNPGMEWEPVSLPYLAAYSLIHTRSYNNTNNNNNNNSSNNRAPVLPSSAFGLGQVPPFSNQPAP